MSSGFVSGGTTDNPIERDNEWLKAQQEIEANRLRKEEESRQEGGKTLYEVLQSNKAAKQDAFEESIRLKNQFRNLDEDEVEFLDSVLESTRKKEAEVKKQTSEQLDLFRRQQEEVDKAFIEVLGEAKDREGSKGQEEAEKWALNRGKRKRGEEKKVLKGFKLRKASSLAYDGGGLDASSKGPSLPAESPPTTPTKKGQPKINASSTAVLAPALLLEAIEAPELASKPTSAAPSGLGLAGYSSDDEE